MSAVFRVVNWAMCALFLLSVAVQWNDPDPLRWMAIYTAALVVSLVVARRGRIARAIPIVVAVVAVVWSVAVMETVPTAAAYTHMFDAWEMKSVLVEEAREATGLLIVTGWMVIIAVAQRGRKV